MFSRLAKSGKTNPEYHYYHGLSLQNAENRDESIDAFIKAILMDSTHIRSFFQLAKYCVTQNDNDSALVYANRGLSYYSENVSLINLKALALYNNSEYGKAIPWFEKLLQLGESKEYIYAKLGYSYYRHWEFDKAKIALKKVLEINETNADAYFQLAQTYYKEAEKGQCGILYQKIY
ncbi:tetratricopeptide repeat protein [Costertonia aggregata]|uniref:Tetratricopeptide repeat protein n=1 Tax=Costertonia aggregata TaxID=343403 RepID=A0A7H9AN07_9FLAO|nr:CDC27 family protein [Costertonia aggregata]QLG44665.1 tetratricopeptide repeat protein [Costertonia aggregata]